MDSRYIMGRVLRGCLVEGVRKKDFMLTYDLLYSAIYKMYGDDNPVIRSVVALNNLLRLGGDFEFFSLYFLSDDAVMQRLDSLYDGFNKSKYGSWLLSRMREVSRAYVNDLETYEFLSDKNMGMLRLGTLARQPYPSRLMYQARDIFSLVTFDINRYKSFKDLMIPLQRDKIESAYNKIVSLPDGYEEDAAWLGSIGGSGDQVMLVSGSDLSRHLGQYVNEKDLIGLFGQDFWDSYYEWLCVPKYFAVAVCSYDGAAAHGEGTNWCTRFGVNGDHTEKYLSEGPLFVIYCNSSLETPPGVADGLVVRGNTKRVAQASWYSDGRIREVNDVKNASIEIEKRFDMYLDYFLDALFEVSSDLREDWTPPEKNYKSVVKEDVWGQEVRFESDGSISVEDGVSYFVVSDDVVTYATDDLVPNIMASPGFYISFLDGYIDSVRVDMNSPLSQMNRYFYRVENPNLLGDAAFTSIPGGFDAAIAIFRSIFATFSGSIVPVEMLADLSHVEDDIVIVVEKSGSLYCMSVCIEDMPNYFRKSGINPVGIGFAFIDDDKYLYTSGTFKDVTYLSKDTGLLREDFEVGGNVRVDCFIWSSIKSGVSEWEYISSVNPLSYKVVYYKYPEFYKWYRDVFIPLILRYNDEYGSVYRSMDTNREPTLDGVYIIYNYAGGVRGVLSRSGLPSDLMANGFGISFRALYDMFEEDMPNMVYSGWKDRSDMAVEFLKNKGVLDA